jgi:hypothetical protein
MAYVWIAPAMEESAQVVDGSKVQLSDNGRKAALKQILLVFFKHNAHVGIDMLLKEPIVLREYLRN